MQDVRSVLIEVLKDVEEAAVPDDLREIAFAKVFDLRAGSAPTQQRPPAGSVGGSSSGSGGSTDALEAIAAKVGVGRETVAEVFDLRDGNIELIIGAGKLPSQVARGTKEIALLVAGGRQAAGLEEWTSWDVIRDWCSEFKRLDSGNFAKTVRSMEEAFNFRKESDRKTLVKLSRPGWETFAATVKRLGGEA